MSGNAIQYTLRRAAEAGFNQLADPGNGGTIQMPTEFDAFVSLSTLDSVDETRIMPYPDGVPVGCKLTVMHAGTANSGIGLTQQGTREFDEEGRTTIFLSDKGSIARFELGKDFEGSPAWRHIGSSGVTAPTGSISIPLPLDNFRVTGTGALLGNTAGTPTGALGRTQGTYGTAVPTLVGEAASGASTSNVARTSFHLPSNYIAGQNITVVVNSVETVGAATVASTTDIEAYSDDGDGTSTGDLCATAAIDTTIVAENKTFTITGTSLTPGQLLDIELTLAANDTGGTVGTIVSARKVTVGVPVYI